MKYFRNFRFPKIAFALYMTGALVLMAIPVRIVMGATLNLPPKDADFLKTVFPELFLPILFFGLPFALLSLLLWLPLRKKGFRFMDIGYPSSTLGAIAIFIFFHLKLIV